MKQKALLRGQGTTICKQIQLLPEIMITDAGPLSRECLAKGLTSFRSTCHYVQNLPYGKIQPSELWQETLRQETGTSLTKHTFLKALADELEIPMELMLGIYAMTEQNTPGVGVVLDRFRMLSLPEVHCYLLYNGHRLDFTRHFYDDDLMEPILSFIHEEPITVETASDYKEKIHKSLLRQKFGNERLEHIWSIRERCMAAIEN